MECSCTIETDMGDVAKVYRSNLHIAKKDHQCSECCRVISIGEKYEYVFGVWDSPSVYKTCVDCLSIRDQFFSSGWQFTMIWDNFTDEFCYCDSEVPEHCISQLTKNARNRICEWIENQWDLEED